MLLLSLFCPISSSTSISSSSHSESSLSNFLFIAYNLSMFCNSSLCFLRDDGIDNLSQNALASFFNCRSSPASFCSIWCSFVFWFGLSKTIIYSNIRQLTGLLVSLCAHLCSTICSISSQLTSSGESVNASIELG